MNTIKVIDLYEQVNDGLIISDIELQRAIVYDEDKQAKVIDSLNIGVPLPAIYLWKNADGRHEVLDGKQRIEAIKKFLQNDLQYNGRIWREWDADFQQRIRNVELTIIECSGDDDLKRKIFNRINTLGVPLTEYEVLNGLFHGRYLDELTDHYNQDPVYKKVLKEEATERGNNRLTMLYYILECRHGRRYSRKELQDYVESMQQESIESDIKVIKPRFKMILDIFGQKSPVSRKDLLRIARENLNYRAQWLPHKDAIQKALARYIKSDNYKQSPTKFDDIMAVINAEVQSITLDPRRLFTAEQKQQLLDKQTPVEGKYRCAHCPNLFYPEELTVDHITPWSKGGRTELSNAQLLCRACNSSKGNKQ